MVDVINILTVLFASIILIFVLYRMIKGRFTIMLGAMVLFYIAQVVPLIVGLFYDISSDMMQYKNMYAAINDEKTCIVYCVFVVSFMLLLLFSEKRLRKYEREIDLSVLSVFFRRLSQSYIFRLILIIGMLTPLVAVFLSPDPTIYLQYCYFYTHSYDSSGSIRLYHQTVVSLSLYLSFFCSMLQYLITKKKHSYWIYIIIFVDEWIEGKRSLLVFMLLAILAIDFVKQIGENKIQRLLKKFFCFGIVIVFYFFLYRFLTQKGADSSIFLLYTVYFDKASSVKTAIYDQIYTKSMLDFPGQSLLYDIGFFIPRAIWNSKPVLFCKYFTSYVMGTSYLLDWNLLVNIETEFIANLGWIGVLGAALFLHCVVKISLKTRQLHIYCLGILIVYFYLVFGFEVYLQLAWLVWIVMLVLYKMPKIKFKV